MIDELERVVKRFEVEVSKLNQDRRAGPFGTLKVRVLGQQALLIRRASLSGLRLLATTDFDAVLNGEPPLEDIFKRFLREEGLTYDEQSPLIWLPEETKCETIYKSEIIEVEGPLPIYLIVSKAVKAPEKNKLLVTQAIEVFGDEFLGMLEKYGADINYFIDGLA